MGFGGSGDRWFQCEYWSRYPNTDSTSEVRDEGVYLLQDRKQRDPLKGCL
jgi:hypothetical protein